MASDVREVGKGFFSSEGSLKSKEEVKKQEAVAATPKPADPTQIKETSSSSPSDFVKVALNAERTRFSTQANTDIDKLNKSEDVLKKAEKITVEQIKQSEELKKAVESDDQARIDNAKKELQKLAEQKAELKAAADKSNKEDGNPVTKNLKLGSKEVGPSYSTPQAKLAYPVKNNVSSAQDADRQIQELKGELSSIQGQSKQVADAKSTLGAAVQAGNSELDKISDNSIRTIEKASQTADKIASAIKQAGPQAVNAFNAQAEVVKALVS